METLFDLFNFRQFLLVLLVFAPLEYLLPIYEKAKLVRRGWLPDVLHFFVSGIFIKIGLVIVIIAAVKICDLLTPAFIPETLASMPLWLQVVMAIIVADLGFYLSHRMMHAVPFLWRFHAVHHSSEELDWLASYRVHPVDQVIVKGSSIAPVFVFGFSDMALLVFGLIYTWHSVFLHSNVRIKFGPLKWLIATPEFHHWHHANQKEAYDKNFAGQLSFYDWLFGTVHMTGKMPHTYGVDDAIPEDYMGQMVYPFMSDMVQNEVDLQKDISSTRTSPDASAS